MTNNRVPPKPPVMPLRQMDIFPCSRCNYHLTDGWVCGACRGYGVYVDRTPKKRVDAA